MTSGNNPPITDPQSVPPFEQIAMGELLPQRPPYLLVDRLLHYDADVMRCRLVVTPDHLMVDGNHLSAAGLIEHIAQTCAARIGFINKYILHRPVTIGYVASISSLLIDALPEVGSTVETEVRVLEDCFGMTLINARVSCGGRVIAAGEMKIALTDRQVPATEGAQ